MIKIRFVYEIHKYSHNTIPCSPVVLDNGNKWGSPHRPTGHMTKENN